MRLTLLTLTGLSATLVTALQSGQIPAKRMLGVKKSDVLDDQYEVVYLSGDATVEKKLEIDIPDMVTTNHVLALRDDKGNVAGHFLIEDAKLDTKDGNEIANILIAGAYDETTGNVRDAHDGQIFMPANVTSDRARIRLSDGNFVNVDTSDFGDGAKLTASLIDTANGQFILIGAEGDTAIFTKPVSKLIAEANEGKVQNLGEYTELDNGATLNRIARAKGDEVTIQTDQGAIKAKVEEGKVSFGDAIEAKAPMADDADTLGTWDNLGETDAIVDDGGNRSQAWAKPNVGGGVKLAFLPNKGATPTEAQV